MNELILFSIYDKISKNYSMPQVAYNDKDAIRAYQNILSSSKYNVDDFELYLLGTFDPHSATIDLYQNYKLVARGMEVLEADVNE